MRQNQFSKPAIYKIYNNNFKPPYQELCLFEFNHFPHGQEILDCWREYLEINGWDMDWGEYYIEGSQCKHIYYIYYSDGCIADIIRLAIET
jgi:hypothetical protein